MLLFDTLCEQSKPLEPFELGVWALVGVHCKGTYMARFRFTPSETFAGTPRLDWIFLKDAVTRYNTGAQKVVENPILTFQSKQNANGDEIFPDYVEFTRTPSGIQYTAMAGGHPLTYNKQVMSGLLREFPTTDEPFGKEVKVLGLCYCLDEKTKMPKAPWLEVLVKKSGEEPVWRGMDKFSKDNLSLLRDVNALLIRPIKIDATAKLAFTLTFPNMKDPIRITKGKWPEGFELTHSKLFPRPLASPSLLTRQPSPFALAPARDPDLPVPTGSVQHQSTDIYDDLERGLSGTVPVHHLLEDEEGLDMEMRSESEQPTLLAGSMQLLQQYEDLHALFMDKTRQLEASATRITDLETRLAQTERHLETLQGDLKTSKEHGVQADLALIDSQARIKVLEAEVTRKRKSEEQAEHNHLKRLYQVLIEKPVVKR